MRHNGLEIIEADLLFSPIKVCDLKPISTLTPHPSEALIQRDKNFKISLEMNGKVKHPADLDRELPVRLGTVSETESTEAKSYPGSLITHLHGISLSNRKSNLASGEFTLYGSAAHVTQEYNHASPASSVILYLLGFPSHLTSRSSERNSEGEIVLHRPNTPEMGSAQTIKKPAIVTSADFSRDCILINSQHGTCLFSKGAKNELSAQFNPSYLHFVNGLPLTDKEVRTAFNESVNFVFGKRFIEIGYTALDKNNNLTIRSSRSPYSLNVHAEAGSHELPPTSILKDYGFIDEQVVTTLVDLFLNARDKFKLSDVLWNIWTARMMPLGLELVAYASALEALINAWFESKENLSRSKYVSDDEFEKYIRPYITELKTKVPDTLPWKKVIDRVGSVNQLSLSDKYRKFFSDLGLKIGKVENEVILSRHKFAHGGSLEDNEIKRLIIIARSYEALLNRCILKVIGFQGEYKDYSTLDFPDRPINEPLGGPNNDGNI